MTPTRWQQVEVLFQAALECPLAERTTFLSEACADDHALQQEVVKLLASFDKAEGFLDQPLIESLGLRQGTVPLTQGQRLGHYEIVSLLGRGGMGEVYLAQDTRLKRPIALKLLPEQFTHDRQFIERFEQEARAASALNHPNIITVHDIGYEAGVHFIATEFIAGETLRARLERAPLALPETLAIATQITEALVAAHAAGIIHRDIKPENVMIRPDGLAKVLDFGLSKPGGARNAECGVRSTESEMKASDGKSVSSIFQISHSALHTPHSQTDPRVLMGTLRYLAPEQIRHATVDERTDLFSLGVVLYEMLTGRQPFIGTSAAAALNAIQHEPPAPLPPDTPPALVALVMRALAKEPGQRYQSATDLRAALEQFAQSHVRVSPPRWRKRAALAATLALLMIVGVWYWQTHRAPLPFRYTAQKLTDLPGQELFPTLSSDGQSVIFASNLQGNWDLYRQSAGARTARNLTEGSASNESHPALSPDGASIAFRSTRDGHGIFLMNSDGSNVRQLTREGNNPCWSPDGRELALADDVVTGPEVRNPYPNASRLWAINVATGEQRVITTHDAVQPNWSPAGYRLAFWGEQKGGWRDIWTVAASGGEPVPVTNDEYMDWNPVWSPDGDYLYFLSNRGGEMNLWRVAIDERTGKLRGAPEPATLPSNNCQHISFARNGSALVYGQHVTNENLWQIDFDPLRGEVIGVATPLTQGLKRYAQFAFAPDEQRFVYLTRGEPRQDLFIASRVGTPLRRLTDDDAQDIYPRWSPNGDWIAFISTRGDKYEIWKIRPDGTGLMQMTHEPSREVISPAWLPDGRRLSYQIRNGDGYIVDAEKPGIEQTPQRLLGQTPIGFLAWDWSPDAQYLAGWQPEVLPQRRGLAVYSIAQQRFERLNDFGFFPVWLQDGRRLLFREFNRLFVIDRETRKWREIFALTPPNHFGHHALARDNRRIYFTSGSTEADLWLLKLQ